MKFLTVPEVNRRVEEIASVRHDAEVAHSKEDALYRDVLKEIAAGSINASRLARAALKAATIKFERWYA